MRYSLFSDPHLGTRRQAHTTSASARRLQHMLYVQALVASEPPNSLCLGDLFDRASNDEATLVQGHAIARRCRLVMAGNHDMVNREGVVTTLDALHNVLDDRIVIAPDLTEPYVEQLDEVFWIVPHHASQAVFDEALELAMQRAGYRDVPHRYLLLHCNYEVPFDVEDNTLNLTAEQVRRLLTRFSRIFVGHEHRPKTHFDERLVLVGNTHPTSFADISDKFRWELDVETDTLERVKLWDEATLYRELEYGRPLPDLKDVQFVDVVGSEPVDNGVEVADYVRSVWAAGDRLLAVRNHVEIRDHLADLEGADTTTPALVDLKGRIAADLADSDLAPLYRRLVAQAEAS